ncbi:MAG: hypothetical protein IPP73_10985 [Chitinophagaceae bacterium]|nr:hypothetical protein [Chitinophagaceae bacterium]
MKKLILICFLFTALHAAGQYKTRHFRISNPVLQAWLKNSGIKSFISFNTSRNNTLYLQTDSTPKIYSDRVYGNSYQLDYAGHRYLLQIQFGEFPRETLRLLLDSLIDKNCETTSFKGKIYADHVEVDRTSYCSKLDEDRIFTAIEHDRGFIGGPEALRVYMRNTINHRVFNAAANTDSVFFFSLLIKKDSLVHDITPLGNTDKQLLTALKETFMGIKEWIPFFTGGFYVNSYLQVFIYLPKSGELVVDFRR